MSNLPIVIDLNGATWNYLHFEKYPEYFYIKNTLDFHMHVFVNSEDKWKFKINIDFNMLTNEEEYDDPSDAMAAALSYLKIFKYRLVEVLENHLWE